MARQSHWGWLVVGGWWLVAGGVALAKETEPVELGRILISPRRMLPGAAMNETEFPGNATVITAEEIAASNATTVQEVLTRAEGVTLIDTHGFGLGSDSGVNLRGIVNSSRTNALVLIDGVRQNRITGDEVHWQSIPVEQIARIEILRGGGGTIYGEGALAGVINIITKQSSPQPISGEVGTEVGSYGQLKYWTAARGSEGPVSYGVSATRRQVQGYRESTNSRGTAITAHGGVRLGEFWRVATNVLHSEDTTYFPGGITVAQTEARRRQRGSFNGLFDDELDQVSMDVTGELGGGVTTALNAYWRERATESVASHFATYTPSKGVGLRLGHVAEGPQAAHTLIMGMDLADDKATGGTRGSSTHMSESNRTAIGLYLEETLTLWNRLTLVGGYRFDKSRYEEDITFPDYVGTITFQGHSPRFGATVHVTPETDVFASYARVFKAPNIDDLDAVDELSASLFGFRNNISVAPQRADHYEFGLRQRPVGWWPLELEATYFHTRIDDELMFDYPALQTNNFDTVRDGVELSLRGRWWQDRVQAYTNYAFVNARFRQGAYTGYKLPATPEHQFKLGGSVEALPHLTVGMDWSLVNRQFRINDFLNRLPADNYGTARLTLRYALKHLTAYVNIENLTQEEYTTFQSSIATAVSTGENPAPPMTIVGGVVLHF